MVQSVSKTYGTKNKVNSIMNMVQPQVSLKTLKVETIIFSPLELFVTMSDVHLSPERD